MFYAVSRLFWNQGCTSTIYYIIISMLFTFKENNIRAIAPQAFSGLPNLDTLDLSKNKLDDESLGQNLVSVSNSALSVCYQSATHTAHLQVHQCYKVVFCAFNVHLEHLEGYLCFKTLSVTQCHTSSDHVAAAEPAVSDLQFQTHRASLA